MTHLKMLTWSALEAQSRLPTLASFKVSFGAVAKLRLVCKAEVLVLDPASKVDPPAPLGVDKRLEAEASRSSRSDVLLDDIFTRRQQRDLTDLKAWIRSKLSLSQGKHQEQKDGNVHLPIITGAFEVE